MEYERTFASTAAHQRWMREAHTSLGKPERRGAGTYLPLNLKTKHQKHKNDLGVPLMEYERTFESTAAHQRWMREAHTSLGKPERRGRSEEHTSELQSR